jgi:hypothetical protein
VLLSRKAADASLDFIAGSQQVEQAGDPLS